MQTTQQEQTNAAEDNWVLWVIIGVALALVATILITTGLTVNYDSSKRKAAEKDAYAGYLNNVAPLVPHIGCNMKEARQFEPLEIEGTNGQFQFGWYTPHRRKMGTREERPPSITVRRTGGEGVAPQDVSFNLEHRDFISPYGDINLAPRLNVPVTLHVLRVREGNGSQRKDVLEYTVSYHQ